MRGLRLVGRIVGDTLRIALLIVVMAGSLAAIFGVDWLMERGFH